MQLLPDTTFLCVRPVQTIEILCCACLYLQSLDYRSPAYILIRQALGIALEHGMHTDMQSQHIPEHHVRRCRNIFWTVYILDRQLSSLMGLPTSIRDEDISAELPYDPLKSQKAMALDIQVKLSRVIAKIANNVYGPEGRLDVRYVANTKDALKDIASTEHGVGEALLINKEKGLPVESVNTQNADIDTWRKGTLETIDLLEGTDYLAVKLTGAGPTVTAAFADQKPLPKQMTDALDEIATKCQQRDVRILVDAESQRFQWGILDTTLNLMRKFNRSDRALIYNTYQAYLKSTASTIHKHMETASKENFTLGLKLVRGAYINSDERSLIHDTKEDTDSAYNTIALGALKQEIGKYGGDGLPFPKVNLFLASHNKPSVLAAHALHQSRIQVGLPTVPVGFGQLQGMSDEVSFGLLALKQKDGQTPEVYKCSTWGSMSECLAYLLRRAVENRDAVSRTGDELHALRSEAWRRMKGMFISP
ncbi:hypothetical protein VTO58DRAFT_105333 [Aureobasidium pullulans]